MAKRKKAAAGRRGKAAKSRGAAKRAKAARKPAKRKAAKRGAAKAKAKPVKKAAPVRKKRAAAKRPAPRKQPMGTPVEVIEVETIEEPVPGVVVVTDYEAVRIRPSEKPGSEKS